MLITTNHWRLVWLQALLDGKEVEASYLADLKVSAGMEKLAERQKRVTLADLEQASGHDPRQRRVQAALEVMRGNLSRLALPARFTILTPYVRNPSRKQQAGLPASTTSLPAGLRSSGTRDRAYGPSAGHGQSTPVAWWTSSTAISTLTWPCRQQAAAAETSTTCWRGAG